MTRPMYHHGARRTLAVSCLAALLCLLAPAYAPTAFAAFADEADGEPATVYRADGQTALSAGEDTGENTGEDAAGASGQGEALEEVAFPAERTGATSVDDSEENLVDPTQRADNSFIYDTSIGAIAGQSTLYDNRIVQIEGEVIGDRIAAGDGRYWVEISSHDEDDTATISVLLSEDQTAQIDRYGRYGVTGTTLQVRGTYHQACDEHEGLSDIHATNSAVVAVGEDHPDELDIAALIPGLAAVLIGVALLLIFRIARERMR